MNRIHTQTDADELLPQMAQGPGSSLEAGLYRTLNRDAALSVFTPLHYEPNYAYPLFIWLHGPRDDERQLKRIMPLLSLRNYVAVGIRGSAWQGRSGSREINARAPLAGSAGFGWRQTPGDVALAEQRLFDAREVVAGKLSISSRRVFVAGFDCGGTMALRLALQHPEQFAGVLSLGGEFPDCKSPLGRILHARRVPVFLACGRESRSYPTSRVCENLRLLHAAGMSVSLRQYPCAQEIAPAMLSDMDRWMMELVTGIPQTEVHPAI